MGKFTVSTARRLTKTEDKGRVLVRVSNKNLSALGKRATWVCISTGGRKIYRQAFGGGETPGIDRNLIEIDYNGLSDLGLASKKVSTGIQVKSCHPIIAHWNHPNEQHKWTFRAAAVAVVATIVSIFI